MSFQRPISKSNDGGFKVKYANFEWADHWQRKSFALFLAVCIWYATSESLEKTRTFPDVPVSVINIATDRTIAGISPGGVIHEKVTLVLKGKKAGIAKLTSNQIEVKIDAQGRDRPWVEKIKINQLHNSTQDLPRIVNKVILGEVNVPLVPAIHDSVPFTLGVSGKLNDSSFTLIDFWPRKEKHMLFGPEQSIRDLQLRGFSVEIDLAKVDLGQLRGQWATSTHQFDEISYNYNQPVKCSAMAMLPNVVSLVSTQSMQQVPQLYFLCNQNISLDIRLPVTLDIDKTKLDARDLASLGAQLGGTLTPTREGYLLQGSLVAKGASRFFLDLLKDYLTLSASVKTDELIAGVVQWTWYVKDAHELESRYIAQMQERDTEQNAPNESFYRRRFNYYLKALELQTHSPTEITLKRGRKFAQNAKTLP